ncbi:TPA: hypothetical protein ACITZM_001648, partial [Salmonella enterica subsp. enterica serovar Saintpaul]
RFPFPGNNYNYFPYYRSCDYKFVTVEQKSSHQPKMLPGLIAFPFFTVRYLRTTLDSNYSLYEAVKDGAGFGRQAPYFQCWKDMAGS